LKYVYDATDTRVLKSATDGAGVTRHTAYVFPSLELRQTDLVDGDYARGAGVEVVHLRAHGVHIGEVHYESQDVPSLASGRQHVLLRLGDHLGSTTGMIDKATGELVERRTYQAYGAEESDYRPARWAAFHASYGFTGKEEDSEVGLQYFGHRYLSPALMRWISADPLALHQLKEDLNVYAYIHGNVFAAIDPNGLGQEDTHAGVTYLLGLAAGLNPLDAGRLAFACANVDHNPNTNPVSATHYYNWTTWAFHFDREGASKSLDAEIAKGKDMNVLVVGTWFHTLEDTGFSDKTPGPHMRGQMSLLDKTLRAFTAFPPPGRSTHGTFVLESGEKQHGTSHAVDLIKNEPFKNAQLFMDVYRKLAVVADSKYEGKGRGPNDEAAIRMIEDIVGAGGRTPKNPLTMNPADYGLPGRPFDDYTSRIPNYQFNMNADNPNGKGTQTPVDNAN
jgi:RHS repeat-associated protein